MIDERSAAKPPTTVPLDDEEGVKRGNKERLAKLIIRLVNGIAEVVNRDPAVRDGLKVVFFPDFNVKNAHFVYPAADLSEQISTAGKEASGTGNMKFSMNGALTLGTLDGANVEIRESVGPEHFFLFGLTGDEVLALKARGYDPRAYLRSNADLEAALVLVDFEAYAARQRDVDAARRDPARWDRASILNAARMSRFSSDRAIREYAERIWGLSPVKVELET